MPELDLGPNDYRKQDRQTGRWGRPLKPFKRQPPTPEGNPAYSRPIYKIIAVILGLWAGGVIVWAHTVTGQNPWVISLVSLGPGLLYALLLLRRDE